MMKGLAVAAWVLVLAMHVALLYVVVHFVIKYW
jgi:hypothetical protein